MTPLPSGLDVDALLAGFQLAFWLGLTVAVPFAGWSIVRKLTGA